MNFRILGPCSLVLGFLLAGPLPALADGGVVLAQEVVGPYRVTLFGSPSPLRAGPADLSVMLQDAATGAPVLDQTVAIQIQTAPSDTKSEAWVPPCCSMKTTTAPVPATHSAAQNKLLYAASVLLPVSGSHDIKVRIGGNAESLRARVSIQPPAPPITNYWAYLALPPLLIGGFALNQRLRRRSTSI